MGSVNCKLRNPLRSHRKAENKSRRNLFHLPFFNSHHPQGRPDPRDAPPRPPPPDAMSPAHHVPGQKNIPAADFIEISDDEAEPALAHPRPPDLGRPEQNVAPLAQLAPNRPALRAPRPDRRVKWREFDGMDDFGDFDQLEGLDEFDGFAALDAEHTRHKSARVMEEEHRAQATRIPRADNSPSPNPQDIQQLPAMMEIKIACVDMVVTIFPDICRDFVSGLYDKVSKHSDQLINHILESEVPYPKAKDSQKTLKRKRDLDEEEELTRKYSSADRVIPVKPDGVRPWIRHILSLEFPETPMTFIDTCLYQDGFRLFPTYRVLEQAHRTFDPQNPPYNKLKVKRKMSEEYQEARLKILLDGRPIPGSIYDREHIEILQELQAARRVRKKADADREEERRLELEEEANLLKAQAEGTIADCGCCFGEYPLNRMVHCSNEEALHWFCRDCARQNAETAIGQSKYQLVCMSTDGCASGFSQEQRSHFLDEKLAIALERSEQEANLRMAGIENLASCPFCPFAAEYPPVEIDKEFRCQAPDCERISCRLCKLESHIPKSCEENAKDNGLSIRRQIEEAMSEALIRKCNKCGTPFVKEEGCNKMTCTRNGCFNVQCYICSKSCNYDHFNDPQRGGRVGNCPLFESTQQRHDDDVRKAEKDALERIRAEHPEYSEEDLKIQVSEAVLKDDERRRANNPRARPVPMGAPGGPVYQAYQEAAGLNAEGPDLQRGYFAMMRDALIEYAPQRPEPRPREDNAEQQDVQRGYYEMMADALREVPQQLPMLPFHEYGPQPPYDVLPPPEEQIFEDF